MSKWPFLIIALALGVGSVGYAATLSDDEVLRKWGQAAWQYCQRDADPSLGVRNVEPQPRNATWTHLKAINLAKVGWRSGYSGLTALIAVCWDTSLSPVDARTLTSAQYAAGVFSIRRVKTGRTRRENEGENEERC